VGAGAEDRESQVEAEPVIGEQINTKKLRVIRSRRHRKVAELEQHEGNANSAMVQKPVEEISSGASPQVNSVKNKQMKDSLN